MDINKDFNELWHLLRNQEISGNDFRSVFENKRFSIEVQGATLYVFNKKTEKQEFSFSKIQILDSIKAVYEISNHQGLGIREDYLPLFRALSFEESEINYLAAVVYDLASYLVETKPEYRPFSKNSDPLPVKKPEKPNSILESMVDSIDQTTIFEDEMSEDEVDEFVESRDLYVHPGFIREYRKSDAGEKKKLDEVLKAFHSPSKEALDLFFIKHNNKRMKGASRKIFKFYFDGASGKRILWMYGRDISNRYERPSIVLLAFVREHDEQGKIAERICTNINSINKFIADSVLEGPANKTHNIPPYRYANIFDVSVFIPSLSEEQKKMVFCTAPALIQGCAGSGKTTVSIKLFLELEKNGHHPVFVTYTKELVREVRKRLFEETNTNFDSCVMTLKDFLLKKNNKDENSVFYYDHSYFKQWLETTKQYWHGGSAKLRAIDSSVAWTYIRGIVKGFVDSASSSPMLSEKAFIKEAKNEDLDLALAQGIYQVAKDFSMHIAAEEKKNDSPYADDNDLAFLLTKKDKIKTEECLIIDEAQDLTFIQVQALIRCVKNNAIYFCGDVNQRINPTIVDLDRFGAYFFNSNTKLSTFELSNTFRCSEGITRFLNHLADLRRTYVAKQDAKNEVKICTSRPPDEGLWATVCESGKKDLFNVLALACNKANCIIIVPNQKRKDELTSIMPENETRIQTITEAKGLEYDNVLIYDFVTENAAEFEKIFSNTHSRNTFDRLLFNMFYVAGTRARERLIILEEKISETIKNRLFLNVYFDQSTKSVSRFLDIDDDIKGWLEEAVRQEELEDFRSAIHSYERAGKQVYAKDIKRCMLLKEEDDLCKAGPISLAVKSHISCAERLTEAQEFKHAFFIYQKIINTCDPGFSSYGYLLSKQMMTKIITKQDISNQMASYGKSDELITNHRQNYIKLIDNSIIINKEIIDNIALSLKK